MSIPRGTTPTFELSLEGVDLTAANNVYVTFVQDNPAGYNKSTVTKTGEDIEVRKETQQTDTVSYVSVYMTQSEMLGFGVGRVSIQVNWTYADGSRAASEIASIDLTANLLPEVIE